MVLVTLVLTPELATLDNGVCTFRNYYLRKEWTVDDAGTLLP